MEPIFTLAAFTPAEAATITGVSTALQLDWRRHGYLPSNDGHARYDAFDLARMLVMKLLADKGVGPKHTADNEDGTTIGDLADWCAAGVVLRAMKWVEAWSGDYDGGIEVSKVLPEGSETCVFTMLSSNPDEAKKVIWAAVDASDWSARADYLMVQLFRSLDRPLVSPADYFIWWADGEHCFHDSVDTAIGELSTGDPKTSGPIVVLSFISLADQLQERAARPLCCVEFHSDKE